MRSAVTIKERRDGKNVRLQAFIYALAPGALKAERHRLIVPVSITSKSGAQRWAEQVRRDIEAGKPPPQTREGKEQTRTKKQRESKPAPLTVREAVEVYLADCAGCGNAASSIATKRTSLARVIAVLGEEPVALIGEAEASRVRASMRGKGYDPTTINNTMNMLSTMLRRCYALRHRPTPPERIEKIREREVKTSKAYDDSTFEALAVAAAARDDQQAAVVLVFGEAALRLGELVGLEVGDVNLEQRTLRVERSVSPKGEVTPPKNGDPRTVAMTSRLTEALRPLVDGRSPTAPLFTGPRGGRISRSTVRYRLGRVQAAVDVPVKGPHALRHTAATSALTGGADLIAVQQMMGHRNLATTAKYLHDTGDGPKRATAALEKARAAASPTVTDLSRVPRTRVSRVARGPRKKKNSE